MPDCVNNLMWTVIPTGLDADGHAHVAVHLAIRLGLPPTNKPLELGSYPDFVDWPATIKRSHLRFDLELRGLETDAIWKVAETEVLSTSSSKLWRHLFPPKSPVKTCKAGSAKEADPRTQRTYESYSMRKIGAGTENLYVDLAAQSFQTPRQGAGSSGDYRSRFAKSNLVPAAKPTVKEAREHFGLLNLFQQAEPSEREKYCLEQLQTFFADWIHSHVGSPPLEARKKVATYVDNYIGKLQPLPAEGTGIPAVRRPLKPYVFKALVDRAFRELQFNVELVPHWQECAGNIEFDDKRYGALKLPDLIDYSIFHRPLPEIKEAPPADCSEYDFHELVSMLGNHPDLYPHVGLVFDLRTTAPVNFAQQARGRIAARVTWGVPLVQKFHPTEPFTAYEVFQSSSTAGSQRFLPCSRADARTSDLSPSEDVIRHGVLEIGDPDRFHIQVIDTHSTHYKADGVEANETPESPDRRNTSRDAAVPKLRSCGLALVKDNRKDKVQAVAKRNASMQADLNAGKAVTFFAEDLTAGFRVDVFTVPRLKKPTEGSWKSLCLRSTSYELIKDPTKAGQWTSTNINEALDSVELTQSSAANYERDLNAKRLEGAVHSAASRSEAQSDSKYQLLETVFRWENWSLGATLPIKNPATPVYDSVRKPLRIRATHKVSHSLPQLEFGNRYYIRCRAAFLDGSGLSKDECDGAAAKLGDLDGSPFPFQRLESVDSPMILLDEPINPLVTPGEQSANLVLRKDSAVSIRHVVPPRVSPYLALLHGLFDDSREGALKDYMWSEDGSFASTCQIRTCAAEERKKPNDDNAIFKQYTGPKLALKHPYIPDPAAQCLHLALLHRRSTADDVEVTLHEFFPPEKWPNTKALKIELKGAESGQEEDATMELGRSGNTLTVRLKEGRSASVLLCPTLKDRQIHGMPLFQMFRLADQLRKRAISLSNDTPNLDLHWLLGASTKVDLVHAVEKPLKAPEFQTINAVEQKPDSNSVKLQVSVAVDADSTGEFDITAEWTDCVDEEAACDPKNKTGRSMTKSVVGSKKVPLSEFATDGENTIAFDLDHLIGDTKYHKITYSVNGKSRFAPYYPEYQDVVAKPRDETLAGKFTLQNKSTDKTLHICNRATPDLPNILYILPIFRWDLGEREHGGIHRRYGGGLRIYVDKPWCSSGDGELLGVLLAERPESLSESVATLVSQWGIDPLWDGNPLPEPPTPEDFEGSAGFVRYCNNSTEKEYVLKGLSLKEHPELSVSVLGFSPKFDCERKLLYFDVIMRPKQAYYPFVRFALTRFQPNSIAGAYISKVATADFMQLAPDRWVVSYYRHHKLYVYVYGFTYRSSFAAAHGSEMVIAVERRVQGRESDFCWIPAIDPKTHSEVKSRVQPTALTPIDRMTIGGGLPDEVQRGMAVWRAEFDLRGVSLGSDRRVVVQEVETYKGDDPVDSSKTAECERVVFADALKL